MNKIFEVIDALHSGDYDDDIVIHPINTIHSVNWAAYPVLSNWLADTITLTL